MIDPATIAFSVGTRVAGAVVALGYLLGAVAGSMVAVIGGISLMTFGRGLLSRKQDSVLGASVLALFGAAVGVAAFRWQSLDLAALGGAQAVLGPTLVTGSSVLVGASWSAAAAAVILAGLWLGRRPADPLPRALWSLEAVVFGLLLLVGFWGPDPGATGTPAWGIAVTAAVAAVAGAAAIVGTLPPRAIWGLVAVALAAVTASGVLLSFGI